MSIICGSPATPFLVETYLQHIEKALFIAGKYNGKAFGSFVRDTIVLRIKDPLCNVSFNIIGLWFLTGNCANSFVEHIQTKLGLNYQFKGIASSALHDVMITSYGVSGQRYSLSMHGTHIASFDIIFSETFPVNDFDVNCLTYLCKKEFRNGMSTVITKELQAQGNFEKEQLIEAIINKHASLFIGYANKAIKNLDNIVRINDLITSGWTVTFEDDKFTKPINKYHIINILHKLDLNERQRTISSEPLTEQEPSFDNVKIVTPSLEETLEYLIRSNPLAKEAISKIVVKMICESATAIESQPQAK